MWFPIGYKRCENALLNILRPGFLREFSGSFDLRFGGFSAKNIYPVNLTVQLLKMRDSDPDP